MVIRAFITHKKAETFSDCQDRFGVSADTKSIAVSDGMGSTWQQKIWAQLLVDEFIRHNDWLPDIDTIKPLCSEWRKKVVASIQQLKDTNTPENIIYRNERNLASGCSAGATFIGIRFDGKEWSGSVLGDSCLIEWDGNGATFYSSQDIAAFDSWPDFFDSDVSKDGKGTPKKIEGVLSDGKCLLLVSDPFSDFLLEHKKQSNEGQYISQLLQISTHEDFEMLVARWREEGMHNDDTTLVVITDDGSDIFSIENSDNLNTLIKEEKMQEEKKQDANNEQSISEKDRGKEGKEEATDLNSNSTPIDANTVVEEIFGGLKGAKVFKNQDKNGWSRLIDKIKNTIAKVLAKYEIFKK